MAEELSAVGLEPLDKGNPYLYRPEGEERTDTAEVNGINDSKFVNIFLSRLRHPLSSGNTNSRQIATDISVQQSPWRQSDYTGLVWRKSGRAWRRSPTSWWSPSSSPCPVSQTRNRNSLINIYWHSLPGIVCFIPVMSSLSQVSRLGELEKQSREEQLENFISTIEQLWSRQRANINLTFSSLTYIQCRWWSKGPALPISPWGSHSSRPWHGSRGQTCDSCYCRTPSLKENL